jgi:hypothetical protein
LKDVRDGESFSGCFIQCLEVIVFLSVVKALREHCTLALSDTGWVSQSCNGRKYPNYENSKTLMWESSEFKDFDVVVRTPLRRMPMIPLRRRRMPMIPPRRRMLMIPLRRMLMVSKFPLSYRSCSVRSRLGHVNTVNSSLHKTYHLLCLPSGLIIH